MEGDGTGLSVPEFSISLDDGETYEPSVKTFETGADPAGGLKPGINRLIWKAGVDLPDTYVNPAFLRMTLRMTRDDAAILQYQDSKFPTVQVARATPAFEVIQFIAGRTKGYHASSSVALIQPGTYVGENLADLLRQIDPNAWTPPEAEDKDTVPDRPMEAQTGKPVPPEDRDNLKFEGEIIVYPEFPEVEKGEPIDSAEVPRDTKEVTDTFSTQKLRDEPLVGNNMVVRFTVFNDTVQFQDSLLLDGPAGLNFIPVVDEGLPLEPGISLLDERGTVWKRGDYLVGFIDEKGLVDLVVLPDPLLELAHDDRGEHRIGRELRGTIAANIDYATTLVRVTVWRAHMSNHRLPLGNLADFQVYLTTHLTEKASVTREEFSRFNRAIRPQAPTNDPDLEKLWNSGGKSGKYNVVITGDGFSASTADSDKIRQWLDDHLFNGLIDADIQPSYMNAVNFYFFDAKSAQSGITQSRRIEIDKDDIGDYTGLDDYLKHKSKNDDTFYVWLVDGAVRDTAWGLASADWEACWRIPMEGFGNLTTTIITKFNGTPDEIWVVTNDGAGGCASSHDGIRILTVDETRSTSTLLHEWGHTFGRLSDEYTKNKPYDGGADGKINLFEASAWNGTRAGLKSNWKKWIPSWRPLPTTAADVALGDTDVGLFLGGYYATNGVYRPVSSGRMSSNSPLNSPVGNTAIREHAADFREQDHRESFVLDANHDGRTDLVIQDDRQIGLFLSDDRNPGPDDPATGQPPRSVSGVLEPTWFVTDILRTGGRSWEFRKEDDLRTGDFSGDQRDDIIVHNDDSWVIPYIGLLRSTGGGFEVVRRYDENLNGWQMRPDDRVRLADFDGDGRMEMTIFNGLRWSMPYLGIYRINSNNQLVFLNRFDKFLPGWEMGRHEEFHFCDVNGDGADDIVAINQADWAKVHIHIYLSLGNGNFSLSDRFYGQISRGITWNINRKDHYLFGDWDGNETTDFAIFNGKTFSTEFLGLFRFNGEGKLAGLSLHSDAVPGWNFQANDQLRPFNKNGDNIMDFVVFNPTDWGDREYLGILSQDGKGGLSGRWQEGWIGGWNLGHVDRLRVVDFRGGSQWDDLFIMNKNWFGLLRGQKTHFSLEAIYHRWIQNQRYHQNSLY